MNITRGADSKTSTLEHITFNGESYLKITNHDSIRPFFMSVVSDANHWMFISSNGGLTAGRKNAEYSLFPYYTDDKLNEFADFTGSKSIFWVESENEKALWEPFSERQQGTYNITRNIYKNTLGNKILFEEENHDLNLTFRYEWKSSNAYGFVRESTLINKSQKDQNVRLIDGIQNIMPYGVAADFQMIRSNLVDAYKRSELDTTSGIGIYALSAIIVDKAEPSEALKANIAWSLGLENPTFLLSSAQLDSFRAGDALHQESDVKAEKGAYLLHTELSIAPKEEKQWLILADVNQSASDVSHISKEIQDDKSLAEKIHADVAMGCENLRQLVAASDGFQLSSDHKRNTRHYANTLFNIMRGGIFDSNYQIEKWDFTKYLERANVQVFERCSSLIASLPDQFTSQKLNEVAKDSGDKDFTRLSIEYLPLKFSRRHGDPSRPWNKFSINTTSEEDGSKILDYEGNWRDIFQNWEALAHAYPSFIEGMLFKFLNASTFDGYNPYRITKEGIDWEVIEEDDPWSYIGYWGDHQIIYLLKFLEFAEDYFPGRLSSYFNEDLFVYANVPYRIKDYDDLLKDPKDTIDFDFPLHHTIDERRSTIGSDGALLLNASENLVRVNFIEKILATSLAKLSNFIPEGGIWLNTQRPEWNDANNALVGNGVSMVTLYYLRRFFSFFSKMLKDGDLDKIQVSKEVGVFYDGIKTALQNNKQLLAGPVSQKDRKAVMDGLGTAGSDFRSSVYKHGFTGEKSTIEKESLDAFCGLVLSYLDHSIDANKREDAMYHAYNIMTVEQKDQVSISYLEEMLEGQVAVLSSGKLSASEALSVLDSMKNSALFRPDQYSYLLYPNKELSGFLQKNIISNDQIQRSALLKQLEQDDNLSIINKDAKGNYHFNGNFRNAKDLQIGLDQLQEEKYGALKAKEEHVVLAIFEEVFNHKAFTGRSGTFYGYEGLGSIYWHMVSKLLLAVAENCHQAIENGEDAVTTGKLLEHFYEIMAGIGVHKSPALYGAFPTDPYSHTPFTKGAQQPGMTGQVKEDILSRMFELGVTVRNGQVLFNPTMLRKEEFLDAAKSFAYVDIHQQNTTLELRKGALAFTYCQVPVVYQMAEEAHIEVIFQDGNTEESNGNMLGQRICNALFNRSGLVKQINVKVPQSILK